MTQYSQEEIENNLTEILRTSIKDIITSSTEELISGNGYTQVFSSPEERNSYSIFFLDTLLASKSIQSYINILNRFPIKAELKLQFFHMYDMVHELVNDNLKFLSLKSNEIVSLEEHLALVKAYNISIITDEIRKLQGTEGNTLLSPNEVEGIIMSLPEDLTWRSLSTPHQQMLSQSAEQDLTLHTQHESSDDQTENPYLNFSSTLNINNLIASIYDFPIEQIINNYLNIEHDSINHNIINNFLPSYDYIVSPQDNGLSPILFHKLTAKSKKKSIEEFKEDLKHCNNENLAFYQKFFNDMKDNEVYYEENKECMEILETFIKENNIDLIGLDKS